MNAQTVINLPPLEMSSVERAQRAAISIHCPNESEDKMYSRVQIAKIRDRASLGMNHCCDAAYGILRVVSQQATAAVFAQISSKELYRLRCALMLAMDAARALERIHGSREHGAG